MIPLGQGFLGTLPNASVPRLPYLSTEVITASMHRVAVTKKRINIYRVFRTMPGL